MVILLLSKGAFYHHATQQSVHLTLGILRTSQAVFHAFSFFLAGRLRRPRPSAGNANRSAASIVKLSFEKGGIKWAPCHYG